MIEAHGTGANGIIIRNPMAVVSLVETMFEVLTLHI